jgi:hypothetical protein
MEICLYFIWFHLGEAVGVEYKWMVYPASLEYIASTCLTSCSLITKSNCHLDSHTERPYSEQAHLTMSSPVWFVTATSSGFGRAIALEALQRGHKVIATARNSSKLTSLKEAGAAVMDLDVTADDGTLAAKLSEANEVYGKITHVVNAAGYILVGAIEEARLVLCHLPTLPTLSTVVPTEVG